jgi:hydrogenase nickel incorporation protein HypA/HybF
MHELGISQGVLDVVLKEAEKAEAKKVSRIDLVVGEASGVVDEAVRLCFELVSADTIAQGAELTFRHVPLKMRCRACGHSFSPGGLYESCPACSTWGAEVTEGSEFYIDSIEVD